MSNQTGKAAKDTRSGKAMAGAVVEAVRSVLARVRVVLINTTHPGNIGATARAMKVMGLSSLHLVSPKVFPHADATALASGADDILQRAVVHESLDSALEGCALALGTSARPAAPPSRYASPALFAFCPTLTLPTSVSSTRAVTMSLSDSTTIGIVALTV